ncbi:MAG: polyphosphate polymerase domain-containing protein [Ruminiclostridium sp.]|nr:polyphosphate polymerase domain-containing protein [Ruminiclostridium sp.]
MSEKIQYRHELKYRINGGTYHILRQRLGAVMMPDTHTEGGLYRVTSLYLDDTYRTAYRDKVNGALHRKKYRIRVYDLGTDVINLEEKVKDDCMGYKKSTPLTMEQYRLLLEGDCSFFADERYADTAGGDLFASSSVVKVMPSVIVDYIREPYVCYAGNVRITFDMKIAACTNSLDLFGADNVYETVMPENEIVLEIKYDSFLPAHIAQVLTGISASEEAVSKFILCSDKLGEHRPLK